LGRGLIHKGVCLILGGVDTGKTTLAAALAKELAENRPVGIIDADIGQSHIGPPTTVGWAVVDKPDVDFSQLTAKGISFVGDVTPVRHLLQLTAAIVQGMRLVSKSTDLIIIDTPGFIRGSAAAALWWTVQQILKPNLIVAVQRYDELSAILAGLTPAGCHFEHIRAPAEIPTKSPQERRCYRQSQFSKYFQGSCLHHIDISNVSVQTASGSGRQIWIGRLAGLRDQTGVDLAIGVITDLQRGGKTVVVGAPKIDVSQIRCLVISDITADIAGVPDEWR
jgi:polynucleotide 5'-hydroxyl-kinase GRC3/NOL9